MLQSEDKSVASKSKVAIGGCEGGEETGGGEKPAARKGVSNVEPRG